MLVALTGTPGVGKTSVSYVLQDKGFKNVDLNKVAVKESFIVGVDKERNSKILDLDRLNDYVKNRYKSKDVVFLVGHFSHLLKNVDRVIVLRCHPDELRKRLSEKKWVEKKIKENLEAEVLDVILCESLEIHSKRNVFEIDTTGLSIDAVASSVIEIIDNDFRHMEKYKIGKIDWSEEILKDF
jgi:adenylate kinase